MSRCDPDGVPLDDDQLVIVEDDGSWAVYSLTIPCRDCRRAVRASEADCACGAPSPWGAGP